jgi:hypothetical protein
MIASEKRITDTLKLILSGLDILIFDKDPKIRERLGSAKEFALLAECTILLLCKAH